ncbi:hypothetical protein L596_018993 [Steinernema carpocapsae]|uniref:Uncharacterized protein n=1 Tax=Steinernema carpocapsae TaxID=34508 RepID=A0A4U5N6A5_STECR|nr:hypothetical protein L596_018993 [Steinernema carpocapsae]
MRRRLPLQSCKWSMKPISWALMKPRLPVRGECPVVPWKVLKGCNFVEVAPYLKPFSTLSSFFANPVVPSFEPMETIASDVESTWNDSDSVSAHSSTLTGASKEQISSVLSKLHGRASSYKDRYQALALKFNEVVSENEKIRNVLTTTQDKVLEKMEKLRDEKKELVTKLEAEVAEKEKLASSGDGAKVKRLHELLEKCKESISANKDKISQLTAEKERLQANLIGVNDDVCMRHFPELRWICLERNHAAGCRKGHGGVERPR